MKWKCVLDPELHDCPNFVRETGECTKDSYCGFRDPAEKPEPKRQPKWFEKYYK